MTGPSSNSASADASALRPRPRAAAKAPLHATALKLFFAALLLATGGAKLLDIQGFSSVIGSYAVFPTVLNATSAWALAIVEVALGLWLLSGRRLDFAARILIALHLAYLLWLLLALMRGLSIPNCGCFGVYWPRPLTWQSPIEDLVLLSLAVLLWRGYSSPREVNRSA